MAKTNEEKAAYMRAWYARNASRIRSVGARSLAHRRARHTTHKVRAQSLLSAAKQRARRDDLAFTITHEWVLERLPHGCALTGMPFALTKHADYYRHPHAPSIDRIDPKGGYTPDNSRLTISAANFGKNVWTDEVLIEWARALINKHDSAN